MKALKLQSGDASKPSKAISSNRLAISLPILLINRSGFRHRPPLLQAPNRRDKASRIPSAPRWVFRQMGMAIPKPKNVAPVSGAAGRGPPQFQFALLSLLLVCSMGWSTIGLAQDSLGFLDQYPFEGYLNLNNPVEGTIPAVGDTVWAFNEARDDSVFAVTDALGFYQHTPVTSVGDVPHLQSAMLGSVYPNPDPRMVELLLPVGKVKSATEISLRFYNLRGQDVTHREHLSAGSYLVRAFLSSEHIGTAKFLVTDGRFQHREIAKTVSVASARSARAQKDQQEPIEADFVFASPGYFPSQLSILLDPIGTVLPDICLLHESYAGHVLAQGRTGDVLGNLIAGTWRFTNTSSGEEYLAPLDSEGYWSASLPDTIPPHRVFDVQFIDNPDMRTETFTFLKAETPTNGPQTNGPKLFAKVDVHGYTTSYDVATMEKLTRTQTTESFVHPETYAQNETITDMIRNPVTNTGVIPWALDYRKPFSALNSIPSGEYISEATRAAQAEAHGFIMSIAGLPGTINKAFYNHTAELIEQYGSPPDAMDGWVILRERNDTPAPGNGRAPPGANYMTAASGHKSAGNHPDYLVWEIGEAHLGINDNLSGSNSSGFLHEGGGQYITVSDLSEIGWVVTSVANTYPSGAFRREQ